MKSLTDPKACKSIIEIRDALDVIDQEIIHLFAIRHGYVKEIVKFKSGNVEEIIAMERKELVLKQRKEWAKKRGLDPELMEGVFSMLINKNIQIQLDIHNSNTNC